MVELLLRTLQLLYLSEIMRMYVQYTVRVAYSEPAEYELTLCYQFHCLGFVLGRVRLL